ncbi:MAG: Fic family protein [Butyrivibrio sp.]|nr:Fic family protein [Butyrivibrio sp.]
MKFSNALIWCMVTERNCNDRGGIYGFTQRGIAYNSNKIEGSTLTEDQTAALFEEGFLPISNEVYRAKDIEEMNGHFLMFNHMLTTMNDVLSEKLIKEFHHELKAGVFEDRANGYAIGDYKKRANTVNNLNTVLPKDVEKEMGKLMEWYHGIKDKSLETIAMFHAYYELIHPFQDGNGRTGRIIIFRECLANDICPFIIRDSNRSRYITALKKAQVENEPADLVQYFEDEQAEYMKQCRYFSVEERYLECAERMGKQ